MSGQAQELKTHAIANPRLGSAFTLDVPTDWSEMPLNDETVDFVSTNLFQPLVVFGPPYAAVACTVMARPKFATGHLDDWLEMLCAEQDITLKQRGQTTLGNDPVAVAIATQQTEAGLFGLYLAMFEDGGTLYALVVMAPEALWDAMSETLEQVALGFRLLDPQGTTLPPPPTGSGPANGDPQRDVATSYADFALADDPEGFSPDNELNILDDRLGRKSVPSVVEVYAGEKHALVNFASIDGLLNVPFGWNINDDGKTGRVFHLESSRIIEISNLTEITDLGQAYDAALQELKQKHPALEHALIDCDGGPALAMRGLKWRDQEFEKVIIYRDFQRFEPGLVKFDLSAGPEDIQQLLELALLMLKDCRVG